MNGDGMAMHKQSGFTLIELLVYGLLFAGFSFIAFAYLGNLRIPLGLSGQRVAKLVNEAVLQDLMLRDFVALDPSNVAIGTRDGVWCKQILKGQKAKAVWLSYMVEDGFLCRSQGHYDERRGVWTKRKRAYLPTTMVQLSIRLASLDRDKKVVLGQIRRPQGVQIVATYPDNRTTTMFVRFRNTVHHA